MHLRQVLTVAFLAVAGLGLAAELWYAAARSEAAISVVQFFSLSYEVNLPTWYAACLLFSCGLALSQVAQEASRRQAPHRRRWWALAGAFFYLSLDEAVEIHENLADLVPAGGGVLHYNWIIPASVIVACFGLAYLPFLARLPQTSRRRFVTAGLIYVSGALFMEMPLGYVTGRMGIDNLCYGLIDWAGESLELAGASLFLVAVREHEDGPAKERAPAP